MNLSMSFELLRRRKGFGAVLMITDKVLCARWTMGECKMSSDLIMLGKGFITAGFGTLTSLYSVSSRNASTDILTGNSFDSPLCILLCELS